MISISSRRSVVLFVLAMTSACGDSPEAPGLDAGERGDAGGLPDFSELPQVAFEVAEVVYSDGEGGLTPASSVDGRAFDGVPPLFQGEAMRQGDCRLLTYEPLLCEPTCDGICKKNNVCESFPRLRSLGGATVSGLVSDVRLIDSNGAYYADDTPPTNLFESSSVIGVVTDGASPVQLSVRGVAPLESNIGAFLQLTDGDDGEVTWTPAGDGDRVRLVLRSDNDAHGLPLTHIIECDGPDDGSLTIPQAMIEVFPAAAPSPICVSRDCPLSELTRYRIDETSFEQDVARLTVASRLAFPIAH